MIRVYFVGGPKDLTKEVLSGEYVPPTVEVPYLPRPVYHLVTRAPDVPIRYRRAKYELNSYTPHGYIYTFVDDDSASD